LCESGDISVLSSIGQINKTRSGPIQASKVVGGTAVMLFLVKKIPWRKRKYETVRCGDATGSYFVAKFRGEVLGQFHAVAVKRHSSVLNWLFGLPERIICEQTRLISKKTMSMLLTLLFTSRIFRYR
jgi:hypothetical protein